MKPVPGVLRSLHVILDKVVIMKGERLASSNTKERGLTNVKLIRVYLHSSIMQIVVLPL